MKQILVLVMMLVVPGAAVASTCPANMPTSCGSCNGALRMANAQGECPTGYLRVRLAPPGGPENGCPPDYRRTREELWMTSSCNCTFAQGVGGVIFHEHLPWH